ncbi:MAG: MATE family efflux transporter [Deltaproteobacteria bacterium]|nr:MAG: MATE family efflux transporter [Deltaproteobacteria bacterium]
MTQTQTQTLTTRPVPALIREIAVPASVGFFFNTLFNAVDTWWGGQISTQALAALSLSFPVFFIIIAVGSGLASGTTALIGTALGKGNHEEAETFSAQGISFGILVSIVLTAVGLAGSRTLFAFLGASGEYLRICLAYMNVIFAGSLFFIVNHMFSAILNALGDTKSFRNFLIAGCLLNVLLDPWFIYGGFGVPPMSFAGIALATVLIQAMGCLYLCLRVRRTMLGTACSLSSLRPRLAAFREIARQGVPAAANFFTIGLGIFVITYFVSGFGKEAVAAFGAAMRIEQIILLPTIGLSTATLAIVAQNSGARLFDRMDETVRTALRYGGIIMLCGTVALFLFAGPLMTIFTADPAVIAVGRSYLKISAFILYAYVVLSVNVAALQGIRKPMFALWIGLWRQIVAPAAVFWILTRLLDFGLTGVWWGIFGINWSAAAVAWIYARRQMKKATNV